MRSPVCPLFLTIAVYLAAGIVTASEPTSTLPDEVSEHIDAMLLAKMREHAVQPAPRANDAEFLRRVYLDLTGQVPQVSATRDFLADDTADKRSRLVDRLLLKPKTFDHLAEVWRNSMLPSNVSPQILENSNGLHAWLRRKFSDNLRYDRIVSDIVAATGTTDDGPALFFTALELEPKKLASATARIFLGLQLECAECHDHPFDDWKQEEFWGYAAFFARLPKADGMMRQSNLRLVDRPTGDVMLPETQQVVMPKFPGGRTVGADELGSRRQQLSIWMASPENPYVARAAVNRVWALLFGRGLVDPVDDLGKHNPASHPDLLQLLTDYFIDTEYDLRNLIRTLCATEAYQRTSQVDPASAPEPEWFAAMAVKVLTAEQLYDSLRNCLRQTPGDSNGVVPFNNAMPVDYRRLQFVSQMMGRVGSPTDYDRGLQQALRLMNGSETVGATDIAASPLLLSLNAPFFTDSQRMDILYLATLSRYPTESERQRISQFLQPDAVGDKQTAYADVLWALVNSAEFVLNH